MSDQEPDAFEKLVGPIIGEDDPVTTFVNDIMFANPGVVKDVTERRQGYFDYLVRAREQGLIVFPDTVVDMYEALDNRGDDRIDWIENPAYPDLEKYDVWLFSMFVASMKLPLAIPGMSVDEGIANLLRTNLSDEDTMKNLVFSVVLLENLGIELPIDVEQAVADREGYATVLDAGGQIEDAKLEHQALRESVFDEVLQRIPFEADEETVVLSARVALDIAIEILRNQSGVLDQALAQTVEEATTTQLVGMVTEQLLTRSNEQGQSLTPEQIIALTPLTMNTALMIREMQLDGHDVIGLE